MSSYEYAVRTMRFQLQGLPERRTSRLLGRFLYRLWEPIYRLLAWYFAGQPGTRGYLWLMVHDRKWQKSSALTGATWLLATPIVYKLVGSLGYGWEINLGVSLTFDAASWAVHKRFIFDERAVRRSISYGRNLAVWLFFFGVNLALAILVFHKLGGGTLGRRCVLGLYGMAMNPVMFKVRDRIIFAEPATQESILARRQLENCRADFASRLPLIRTGA